MLGDHKKLEKKLRESGEKGIAAVTASKVRWSETTGHGPELALDPNRTSKFWLHLTVDITPDRGKPFSTSFGTTYEHQIRVGQQVPVLFDPSDHEKVVLDRERLAEQGQSGLGGSVQVQVVSRSGGPAPQISTGPDGSIRIVAPPREGDSSSTPEAGRIADLERLAALHASGALTDDEFEHEKAKLLGS